MALLTGNKRNTLGCHLIFDTSLQDTDWPFFVQQTLITVFGRSPRKPLRDTHHWRPANRSHPVDVVFGKRPTRNNFSALPALLEHFVQAHSSLWTILAAAAVGHFRYRIPRTIFCCETGTVSDKVSPRNGTNCVIFVYFSGYVSALLTASSWWCMFTGNVISMKLIHFLRFSRFPKRCCATCWKTIIVNDTVGKMALSRKWFPLYILEILGVSWQTLAIYIHANLQSTSTYILQQLDASVEKRAKLA